MFDKDHASKVLFGNSEAVANLINEAFFQGEALFRPDQFHALPTEASKNYDYSAATLTMDVLYGNTMYKLNSQDDCVQYGNVACDTLGDGKLSGFYVTYVLTADEATARKVTGDKIFEDSLRPTDFAKTDIAMPRDV